MQKRKGAVNTFVVIYFWYYKKGLGLIAERLVRRKMTL